MKKKMVESALSETPRDKIFSTIVKNPGLHFREIQRRTEQATGALQYHIDYLKKKNLIREEKEGKFSRYYSVEEKTTNTKLMNLLRQDQVRVIVLLLIDRRRANLNVISQTCKMSSSTALFHLKKLIKEGIVKEEKIKENIFYLIPEKEPLMELLIIHNKSFFDELVERFVDLWEKELTLEFENK